MPRAPRTLISASSLRWAPATHRLPPFPPRAAKAVLRGDVSRPEPRLLPGRGHTPVASRHFREQLLDHPLRRRRTSSDSPSPAVTSSTSVPASGTTVRIKASGPMYKLFGPSAKPNGANDRRGRSADLVREQPQADRSGDPSVQGRPHGYATRVDDVPRWRRALRDQRTRVPAPIHRGNHVGRSMDLGRAQPNDKNNGIRNNTTGGSEALTATQIGIYVCPSDRFAEDPSRTTCSYWAAPIRDVWNKA